MSKYPPDDYDEPYIGDPLPMGEARPLSEYEAGIPGRLCRRRRARIAELEAERDRLKPQLIAPLSAPSGE